MLNDILYTIGEWMLSDILYTIEFLFCHLNIHIDHTVLHMEQPAYFIVPESIFLCLFFCWIFFFECIGYLTRWDTFHKPFTIRRKKSGFLQTWSMPLPAPKHHRNTERERFAWERGKFSERGRGGRKPITTAPCRSRHETIVAKIKLTSELMTFCILPNQ